MLANDTMNGLADIFSAEPDLAKEIAAIQDQDLANERLRRLADERGVVWREETLYHPLADDELDDVSGGMSEAELIEKERREQAELLKGCRQALGMLSFLCDAGTLVVKPRS